jgi:hypothetical protein
MKASIRSSKAVAANNNRPRPTHQRPVKYNPVSLTTTNILCFFTLYLGFMVTSIVLYNQDNYVWYGIIQDETSEWSQGSIVDLIAMPKNTTGVN